MAQSRASSIQCAFICQVDSWARFFLTKKKRKKQGTSSGRIRRCRKRHTATYISVGKTSTPAVYRFINVIIERWKNRNSVRTPENPINNPGNPFYFHPLFQHSINRLNYLRQTLPLIAAAHFYRIPGADIRQSNKLCKLQRDLPIGPWLPCIVPNESLHSGCCTLLLLLRYLYLEINNPENFKCLPRENKVPELPINYLQAEKL